MTPIDGASVERWTAVFEGDEPGRYVQCIDNVCITRDGSPILWIYENGPIPAFEVLGINGYSREVLATSCRRSATADPAELADVEARAKKQIELRAEHDKFHAELGLVKQLAETQKDEHMLSHVKEAESAEDSAAFQRGDNEAYLASLHRARQSISHHHEQMQKYTGHLVGHAHIDLQWLWTWEETVNEIIPQTFGQAVKFMEEFPDFTFSQSSATLYLATEVHHPELFEKMKKYIAEGRWELVGGRSCEGDTNLISPESHVRHFLYGQRYFQEKFGKTCTVGWEPDTFGHCWTMPQILKKSGIDSYYFCRAGKGQPLFWWEGPDGSRVLAFEEPATGGWYNDVVTDEKVRELLKFVLGVGATDHLMVYGVGNHGGGPTREYIEAANAMKNRAPWPRIKFSTASEFFKRLHEIADKIKAPTIKTELNPIFDGCYTTHSRVKRLNRQAESALESAEVAASLAHIRKGATYPTPQFAAMWQDVLFNHHHDTLPGSFIHAPSIYTAEILEKVIAQSSGIYSESIKRLAPTASKISNVDLNRESILLPFHVFNPLAWKRETTLEFTTVLPKDLTVYWGGFSASMQPAFLFTKILEDYGDTCLYRIQGVVPEVPACGFETFHMTLRKDQPSERKPLPIHGNIRPRYQPTVHVPPIEVVKPEPLLPSYEIRHEKPGGGTAWTIQPIEGEAKKLVPISDEFIDKDVISRRRRVFRYDRSTIIEEMAYSNRSSRNQIDYHIRVEWLQIGDKVNGSDMLKMAIDTRIKNGVATAEIPFGDISRPTDGKEHPMLKWVDLSNASKGVAILNDCKHGYDVKDGVINMTLLRSSYDPDPTPDVGWHEMKFSVYPHDGPLDKAAVSRAAWEFNQPCAVIVDSLSNDEMKNPISWSAVQIEPANIIMTAFKMAEDNSGYILRAYECKGESTIAEIIFGFDAASYIETDLIERPMPGAKAIPIAGILEELGPTSAKNDPGYDPLFASRFMKLHFKPYEIKTIRIERSK